MVRDPSIVSPSLTGMFIGGGHNKHGAGSRCTLPKQCRPPSPRRRWRCDRSSYKRSLFSRIRDSLMHYLTGPEITETTPVTVSDLRGVEPLRDGQAHRSEFALSFTCRGGGGGYVRRFDRGNRGRAAGRKGRHSNLVTYVIHANCYDTLSTGVIYPQTRSNSLRLRGCLRLFLFLAPRVPSHIPSPCSTPNQCVACHRDTPLPVGPVQCNLCSRESY